MQIIDRYKSIVSIIERLAVINQSEIDGIDK